MFSPDTKILIAEDTEITRSILRKILEKLGYRKITEVSDGNQALAAMREGVAHNSPFGLVIADWNMPELNGLALLKNMNAMPSHKNCAFILLTSNTEKDHVIEAIKSGVAMYMAKPFTATTIEKKLQEAYQFYHKKS